MAVGDDWGNLTGYRDGQPSGAVYGMNRLNHCVPLFDEGYRAGDPRLVETAVMFCDNYHDLSIWWGEPRLGGTRYHDASADNDSGRTERDPDFMWRSNRTVHFCTKGFDAFFRAWEQTGDPRMREAFEAQTRYASREVHAGAEPGEPRNIGVVRDFLNLYRYTGRREYLGEALRLFRELRAVLAPNGLFDQGGKPVLGEPPYIEEDSVGLKQAFAKPYIVGYALAGLPGLARLAPDEPRLRETVAAVADFMAAHQDPAGGWRYPHPRSSGVVLGQSLEHAAQLANACALLGAKPAYLDAIERTLRQRLHTWQASGKLLTMLRGWEYATGKTREAADLYRMYARPDARDPRRDYSEGQLDFSGGSPESLVYLPEVLRFYLAHRPAGRLLAAPEPGTPLGQMVARIEPDRGRAPRIQVWEEKRDGESRVHAAIAFPNVPGYTADAWTYESEMEFVGSRQLEGGMVELRHRPRKHPNLRIVTAITPRDGAVEFLARPEVEDPAGAPPPDDLPTPNLCWNMRRAEAFRAKPDPFPEFVKRCFLFTREGLTFLDRTARRKIPVQPVDHEYNNPVWVQMYVGDWQTVPESGPGDWAAYSPDRYATTVIGAVSRDRRHLTALVNDTAATMCQAWKDCLHNNAAWAPAAAAPGERRWRTMVYAMENDPHALLERARRDFPALRAAPAGPAVPAGSGHQTEGVRGFLPVFADRLAARLDFPLSWLRANYCDFTAWRRDARQTLLGLLLAPPGPAPFASAILGERDRGAHVARKLVFNVSAESRVAALMTVPKGRGPFPAVLLLHDHGARFDIGKEKVVEPWGDEKRQASAAEWVGRYLSGRYVGDELARRGYVTLATDALNWSDRGGGGFDGQQALAGNLFHLGASFAGLIAHEDLRAAEFLAGLPEVDARRIGALGFSMGAFRAWQLAALSDRVAAGAAICWMAAVKGLMAEGNNQTKGHSAFTMTHPGLFNYLDYPDAASIACPKPMLFYNGARDKLFPVPAVEEAYAKMRQVWESREAGGKLETRLWDAPHEFNREMQEAAFAWLDRQLKTP